MMNTRIQTLLAKFKETESTHRGAQVLIGLDEIEKFAELIVGECIDKIKNADMTDLEGPDPDDVLWLVEKQIKQHFGVEE